MNYNNVIRSLHRTNDATAQAIMQQYPPQWDMDRAFQKAYRGYLSKKQEQLQAEIPFSSQVTEMVEYTTENNISRSIRRFGGYAGIAAAMIGVFLLVSKGLSLRSPVDQIPDETVPPKTTQTTSETTAASAEESTYESTAVSAIIPIFTDVSAPETTASGTESTLAGTETTQIQTQEIMTELPASGTAAPDVAETTAVTTEMTTESTAPETTTTTTEPPVIPQGHFEVGEQSGSLYQVTYVRENAVPVEEHEHSFAADGFTVTGVLEQNPDYDFRSVIYNLEDAAGQHYMVQQFRYDYFMSSYNPEYYPLTRSYMIGGKSVFLIYQDDPEAVCNLMWDDGCHICVMTSQYKDLAQMELLAQGQIIQ